MQKRGKMAILERYYAKGKDEPIEIDESKVSALRKVLSDAQFASVTFENGRIIYVADALFFKALTEAAQACINGDEYE